MMREFLEILIPLLLLVLLIVIVAVPLMLVELHTFNQLTDSDYSFKEWVLCSDAIKLQYAGKKSIGEIR